MPTRDQWKLTCTPHTNSSGSPSLVGRQEMWTLGPHSSCLWSQEDFRGAREPECLPLPKECSEKLPSRCLRHGVKGSSGLPWRTESKGSAAHYGLGQLSSLPIVPSLSSGKMWGGSPSPTTYQTLDAETVHSLQSPAHLF